MEVSVSIVRTAVISHQLTVNRNNFTTKRHYLSSRRDLASATDELYKMVNLKYLYNLAF